MAWRLASALDVLRKQINDAYPNRSKVSDGTKGDEAHAARKSDHNPNAADVVQALDITHDPRSGVDTWAMADVLRENRDRRIKYVISNGRIFGSDEGVRLKQVKGPPWTWRPYGGSNDHSRHIHISVLDDPALYDATEPWDLNLTQGANVFTNITATVFGTEGDGLADNQTAYADVGAGWPNRPGVALPDRFTGPRPKVKVTYQGRSVVCDIVDVGPWNIDDPYWENGRRPQAESGTDMRGRQTNSAGIDLTPAAANAIGLPGKGLVTWEFVTAQPANPVPVNPSVPAPTLPVIGDGKIDIMFLMQMMQMVIGLVHDIRNMKAQPAPPPVVIPAPPPPPTPPSNVTRPSVQLGVGGVLASIIAQLTGVMGGPVAAEPSTVGNLATLIPAAVAGFGLTGGWGTIASIGARLLGSVIGRFTQPR